MSNITTSQTIGPFSHEAWHWAADASAPSRIESTAPMITISGIVYDGDGIPVNDAQIEAWLPEAESCESAQAVPGFRRCPSGEDGGFTLRLSLPREPAGEPVAYVTVFARGLTKHQFTAIFLEDDPALAQSSILAQVPGERRNTLVATKTAESAYRWDIWLQTDKETVFFDYV